MINDNESWKKTMDSIKSFLETVEKEGGIKEYFENFVNKWKNILTPNLGK